MPFQAFLSHSSRDEHLVGRTRDHVEAAGIQLYLAEHDPHPGLALSQKIQRAIDDSHVVVLLLTPNSYDSAYVNQEVGYALRAGKLVVPLVDPSVPPGALAMLDGVEYIPLQDGSEDAMTLLTEELKHRADKLDRVEVWVAVAVIAALMLVLIAAAE